MNVGMLIYAAITIMVMTVLSNRYWRRQVRRIRDDVAKVKEKVDGLQQELTAMASDFTALEHDASTLERRTQRAMQELTQAIELLEARKEGGTEQYYIFDRPPPRPGRFWEVSIRHVPHAAENPDIPAAWIGVRRYIVIADTERDARLQVATRFPRQSGFDVVTAAPSQITGLTISRIAEYSTFRKPGAAEEEGEGRRRAAART